MTRKRGVGAILGIAAGFCAFAASPLTPRAATPSPSHAPVTATLKGALHDGDIVVTLTLVNSSTTPYPLLKWNLPSGNEMSDVFTVYRNGERVHYLGALAKRSVTADSFLYLQPHHEYSATISLRNLYDLSPSGSYHIRYEAWNQNPPDQPVWNQEITSNEIQLVRPTRV